MEGRNDLLPPSTTFHSSFAIRTTARWRIFLAYFFSLSLSLYIYIYNVYIHTHTPPRNANRSKTTLFNEISDFRPKKRIIYIYIYMYIYIYIYILMRVYGGEVDQWWWWWSNRCLRWRAVCGLVGTKRRLLSPLSSGWNKRRRCLSRVSVLISSSPPCPCSRHHGAE